MTSYVYGSIIAFVCILCFYNTLYCGFVFDDISAIKENRDLRPHSPLKNVFLNDFWGTPMHKVREHSELSRLTRLLKCEKHKPQREKRTTLEIEQYVNMRHWLNFPVSHY